ncbi:hypothetical protein ACLFKT_36880, partial [Paraburkholderia sp. BR14261]
PGAAREGACTTFVTAACKSTRLIAGATGWAALVAESAFASRPRRALARARIASARRGASG